MTKKAKEEAGVFYYLMKGPHAVEKRLAVLDKKLQQWEVRLTNVSWFNGKFSIFQKTTDRIRSIGNAALAEIHRERKALKSFVGDTLRPWETKKSGPAPF